MIRNIRRASLRRSLLAVFAVALGCLATAANAGMIHYGDFSDIPPGGVMYLDVTESGASVPPPRYGAPTISGNSLVFNPAAQSFEIEASGNGPPVALDAALSFTIMTLPGAALTELEISEAGDFLFLGSGTSATSVGAFVAGSVTILEINGSPVASPVPVPYVGSSFTTDLPTAGAGPGVWTAGALLEFGTMADLQGGGVTKAIISIDNILTADSEMDSLARIRKKGFSITPGGDLVPDGNPVPEPTAVAMLAIGFVGLMRRRDA